MWGICFVCSMLPPLAVSQHIAEKFSAGIRVGPNLWVNDMNDRTVGIGVEAAGRYGLSKNLSAGLVLNFEALKAGQFPLNPPDFPVDYLSASSTSVLALVWLHLAPGKMFAPYIYAGGGFSSYTVKDGSGTLYKGQGSETSSNIPIGIGFETFVEHNLSLSLDLGYRFLSGNTDRFSSGTPDGISTVKIGAVMYFGSNDEDDDDQDGVRNGRERELGLDPNNPDTDSDGLTDGDELFVYKTDPSTKDTDGDGLSDGDEVWKFRTDPTKPDTDKDGLSDGDEVKIHNTDPLKHDTDKDGLSDGEEVLVYKTDPLNPDTDGDGLTDSNELFGYKTNPLVADTDGGGVNDGEEVRRNTNPLNPLDDIAEKAAGQTLPQVGEQLLREKITFEAGRATISAGSEQIMLNLLQLLTKHPLVEIEIRGYTDNRGTARNNIRLSTERATAVKAWLEQRGIASERMTVKGFGPANPIVPNTTEEGREANRRIEIIRVK